MSEANWWSIRDPLLREQARLAQEAEAHYFDQSDQWKRAGREGNLPIVVNGLGLRGYRAPCGVIHTFQSEAERRASLMLARTDNERVLPTGVIPSVPDAGWLLLTGRHAAQLFPETEQAKILSDLFGTFIQREFHARNLKSKQYRQRRKETPNEES